MQGRQCELIITKICPSTAPKQERPRPRNQDLNVIQGRVGSSSREMRRVATSISFSKGRRQIRQVTETVSVEFTNNSLFAFGCLVVPYITNILGVHRSVVCRAGLLIDRIFPPSNTDIRWLLECLHWEADRPFQEKRRKEGRAGGSLLVGSNWQMRRDLFPFILYELAIVSISSNAMVFRNPGSLLLAPHGWAGKEMINFKWREEATGTFGYRVGMTEIVVPGRGAGFLLPSYGNDTRGTPQKTRRRAGRLPLHPFDQFLPWSIDKARNIFSPH